MGSDRTSEERASQYGSEAEIPAVVTEKQGKFIEAYSLTGNASKAAVFAGYSEKTSKQQGHKLKKQFANAIKEHIEQNLLDAAPMALAQMRELASDAISESVKLAANKDILDRAGLKPTERIEQTISRVEQSSTRDLMRELDILTKREVVEEEQIPERLN